MSVFIIAEIGINHNGNLNLCKQLIKEAKECGCDAVKFQKRNIFKVYTEDYLASYRESPWGETQKDQKLALELTKNDYIEIADFCKSLKIEWFASSWDLDSQKFLKEFNCKYNKIASPMLVHKPLLEIVAKEGKHTFISTGMSTHNDIQYAVDTFTKYGCSFELMHTVSTYPMKDEHANLNLIKNLKKRYKCNIGYSGHESGVAISIAATALGITSLERHFTLDRTMYGSDQAASIEPNGLRQLVGSVRKIELALGDGIKKILDDEKIVAEKLRQHIN